MIIKKIFRGDFDEEVHSRFLKFGKGEFKNRYLIDAKRQAKNLAVKTSAEFANFLVRECLKRVGGRIHVRGVIVCTFDLKDEINFEIKKTGNFQGIRKIEVDTEVEGKEILDLIEKYPRAFFALSFKGNDFVLKIKAKAPKNAKPGSKAGEVKADFCSLKTCDENLIKELFFDVGTNWKEAKAVHTIKINEIIYPKDVDGLKPEEIREKSKRKGIVVRELSVDGREETKEAGFEA